MEQEKKTYFRGFNIFDRYERFELKIVNIKKCKRSCLKLQMSCDWLHWAEKSNVKQWGKVLFELQDAVLRSAILTSVSRGCTLSWYYNISMTRVNLSGNKASDWSGLSQQCILGQVNQTSIFIVRSMVWLLLFMHHFWENFCLQVITAVQKVIVNEAWASSMWSQSPLAAHSLILVLECNSHGVVPKHFKKSDIKHIFSPC